MANRTAVVSMDGRYVPCPDGDTIQDAGGNNLGGGSVDTANSPVANDIARFTDSDTIEGLTYQELLAALSGQAGADFSLNSNKITNVADPTNDQDVATKAYVATHLAAIDAERYKGAVDCAANPNYPEADAGDNYRVSVAGKIGGASGPNVEAGDRLICHTDSSSAGDHATVGANWDIIQVNIDGAVTTSDTSATTETIVVQDGTSGKTYKKSTKTIAEVERKRLTWTTTVTLDGQNQLTGATVMDFVTPYAGYLVAASIKMKDARTAGSIAVEPHVNGSGLTPTGLDLLIDDDPTTSQYATVSYGTTDYDIAAGDSMGFKVTTSSFTPLATIFTLTLITEHVVS